MMASDREREFEQNLSYLEYHASFTNHDGVKKAKEIREANKEDVIKEAEDFLESAKTNDFKNNPLIEAIRKIREAESRPKEDVFSSMNLNKLISGG